MKILIEFKEKHKIELKTYKDMLDQQIKNFNIQIDSFDRNLKERCEKGKELLQSNLKDEISEFYSKIDAVKIENGRYNLELLNKCKELKAECKEFAKYKEEYEIKLNKYEMIHEKTNKAFEATNHEFNELKSKFVDLSEFIRVNKIFKLIIGCSF